MTTISRLIDEATDIAKTFRLGRYQQAGKPLSDLVDQIAQLPETAPTAAKQGLAQILGDLLKCHKCNDWLGVADYLEFELVTWLRQLQSDT